MTLVVDFFFKDIVIVVTICRGHRHGHGRARVRLVSGDMESSEREGCLL